MNKADLENWSIETFWSAYKGLVKTPFGTEYGAGGRGEAVKKILTMNPSESMRYELITAIAEQMNHRRKLYEKCGSKEAYARKTKRVKFYCNRAGNTWLNQNGWLDEIPSLTDEPKPTRNNDEYVGRRCSTKDCNEPVHGLRFGLCGTCITKDIAVYNNELKDHLRRNGLTKKENETLHEYCMRTKSHAMKLNYPDLDTKTKQV